MRRLLLLGFLLGFLMPLSAHFPQEISGQILYLLRHEKVEAAFTRYLEYAEESGTHDFSLLQQAGMRLLEQGIENHDPEIQLMSLFGAGVANSPALFPVLQKGIRSSEQRLQLVALNYLARQQDDLADNIILTALSSPFLLTRLEGCFQLAQRQHPAILPHLHSLVVKVPDVVRALFPQIVVLLEEAAASSYLRQLLADADLPVRLSAITAVAKQGRDDFLPQIRLLLSQVHHAQQESCAYALGALKDTQAIPSLLALTKNGREEVRLAAAHSLLLLGERDYATLLYEEAKKGSLFALSLLGDDKEEIALLHTLARHQDREVRLNATLALLERGESVSVEEWLVAGPSDCGFYPLSSPGHSMEAWRIIPSHHHKTKLYPGIVPQTLALKEKLLLRAVACHEESLYTLAQHLFSSQQMELIPVLVLLLENVRSERAIALLKEWQQKAGVPLIRQYCTLALYRLQAEGPYEEQVIRWAQATHAHPLIQFRPGEEESPPSLSTHYTLTPEEQSRLLIETFETLAQKQSKTSIEVLLRAIASGNPKNRYALAGLLMRTTE